MEFMKCGWMPKVCVKVQKNGTIADGATFVEWKFCQGDPGPAPSRLKKSHVMFFRVVLYFAALV
jgi:hypothetical protein